MTSLLATLGGALLGLTIAATLIWSVAGLLALLLRRHSAALRHRLWGLSFAAVLAAPLVAAWLPLPRGVEWIGPDATAVSVTEPVSLADAVPVETVAEPLERRGVEFASPANPYQVPVLAESAWPPLAPTSGPVEPAVPADRPVSAALPLIAKPATNLWLLVFSGFVVIWCVGLVLGGSLSLLSRWRLGRLLRRSLPVEHAPVLDLCRDLAARLKLRWPVHVLTSAETAVPFVTGVVQPALVLPAGFGTWTTDRLQVVLAHELMHVRRGDVAWQWLAQTTLAATWFHPLAWVALWRLRVEREHACDDAVLLAGYQPADYATHLVEVAADLRRQTTRFAPAVAMASRSPIERRIRAILDATLPRGPAGRWRTAATMVGLALGLMVAAILTPRSGSAQGPAEATASSPNISEQAGAAVDEAESNAVPAEDNQNPIVAALDRTLTLSFNETSLNDAFAQLARESGIPIQVDLASLRVAHFDVSSPRTIELRDATLRDSILALLQNGASTSRPAPSEPTLITDADLLLITTKRGPYVVPSDESSDPLFKGTIAGEVVDASGQPVPLARVQLNSYWRPTFLTADSKGRFEISAESLRGQPFFASASSPSGDQMIWTQLAGDRSSIKLQLAPTVVRNVQVTGKGKPISDARAAVYVYPDFCLFARTDAAGMASFGIPQGLNGESFCAWSSGLGLDYQMPSLNVAAHDSTSKQKSAPLNRTVSLQLTKLPTVRLKLIDESDQPLAGICVFPWLLGKQVGTQSMIVDLGFLMDQTQQMSDANGEVSFNWLPDWSQHQIDFEVRSLDYAQPEIKVELSKPVPDVVTVKLQKLVEVRGLVTDSQKVPVPFAQVFARGDGYILNGGSGEVLTDEQGRFRLKLPPDQLYLMGAATKDRQLAGSNDAVLIHSGQPQLEVNITLVRTTRVFGRLTIGPGKEPQKNTRFEIYHYGRDLPSLKGASLPNPANRSDWVQPLRFYRISTDDQGRFEISLGPGQYDIRTPAGDKVQQEFAIMSERELEFNLHTEQPERAAIKGRVVAGNPPVGVPHAKITGVVQWHLAIDDLQATADKDGNFVLDREARPVVLFASDPGNPITLAGIQEVGAKTRTATLSLAPVGRCRFRLVLDNGVPTWPDSKIEYGVRIPLVSDHSAFKTSFGGVAYPDRDGWVTLNTLVPHVEYSVFYAPDPLTHIEIMPPVRLERPELRDLGEFSLPTPPRPVISRLSTLADRVLSSNKSPQERHAAMLADANLAGLRGLTLFAHRDSTLVESFLQRWYGARTVDTSIDNYLLTAIPPDSTVESPAARLASDLDFELLDAPRFFLIVQDADGKVLARVTGAELAGADGNVLDPEKLRKVLAQHAPPRLDARELMAAALAQAKAENKRVLVQETATWCGPCWRLTRFLDAHKAVWSQDYVLVKLDQRWDHAAEVAAELRREAEGGIPWMAILDSDGKTLATSNTEEGDNIGFPSASEPAGIEHFLKMLSTTRQRMTDEDLGRLRKALEE